MDIFICTSNGRFSADQILIILRKLRKLPAEEKQSDQVGNRHKTVGDIRDIPHHIQFDDRTEAALMEFQKAFNIKADGRCAGDTWSALLGLTGVG